MGFRAIRLRTNGRYELTGLLTGYSIRPKGRLAHPLSVRPRPSQLLPRLSVLLFVCLFSFFLGFTGLMIYYAIVSIFPLLYKILDAIQFGFAGVVEWAI